MRTLTVALTAILALSATAAPAFAKNDKEKKDPPGQSQNPPGATPKVFVPTACEPAGVQLSALGCRGWFEGNLNKGFQGKGNADDALVVATALNELAGGEYLFDSTDLVPLSKLDTASGVIDFGQMMYGLTIVGFHVGGANGNTNFAVAPVGYNGTAFFKFDAGAGMSSLTFNMPGLSNAALYATGAIPEPATWALMIIGFGGAGAMLRRRRMTLA